MGRNRIVLWICALGCSAWVSAQGFLHPGALHTQADFDRAKAKIEAGEDPWTAAYDKLMTSKHVDLNWTPNPTVKIIRGGGTIWEPERDNYWAAYNDVATAYQCALVWKLTGNTAYADKAIQILNAWARTCKAVSGDSNGCLATGIYGYEFANAGELMRDYEGWSQVDFDAFKAWMRKVFLEGAFDFLERRNGTYDDHYWSNWGLCNVLCAVSIGVLCDDVYTYNAGMEYYKYMENHRYAESLHNLVWILFEDARGPFGYLGQMQESNRDQGHASMAVALAGDICGLGLNQGDDLFAYMDDRIVAGFEYVAAYNCGVDDLPNETYTNSDGSYPEMGSGGRGTARSNWPRIVNYYENVRGVEVPYCHEIMLKDANGIDGGGGFYGSNSGGYDHLGFTALMCSLDPLADKTMVPSILDASVEYDGNVVARNLVNNIPGGTVVTLKAALRNGGADTGRWTWDDDPSCTSPVREVVLDTSSVFRVRYVNEKGVESTQMFALQVEGDFEILPCTPYNKVDGVEGSDTLIYVQKNKKLTLGLQYPGAGVREWKWERSTNGERWSKLSNSTGLLELPAVTSGAYYRVTLVHKSGAEYSQTFLVEVSEIDPYIIYNGQNYDATTLAFPKGSSFSLYAEPNSTLGISANSTRIYQWIVGGDTVQSDTLTYHLNDLNMKVADLNDTLHVEALDTCFSCTLHFTRIYATSTDTTTAETVYRFDIPVYETNVLEPSDDDDYYVVNAESGEYLRNTDAIFMAYSEEDDGNYLWRIRRMPTYGNRYMFISRSNSRMHLSETGAMTTASDYSKHSFNLYSKCTDEDLYAMERSSAAGGGLLVIGDGSEFGIGALPCTGFPYRIVKKEQPQAVGELQASAVGRPDVMTCRRVDAQWVVDAAESGTLQVYGLTGQLCCTVRCEAGRNVVEVPREKGVYVLRYVSATGQVQSRKMM